MKQFKINFKLQTVPHATKPVQMNSLNTKWEGKYLYQLSQTGISVKKEDWDDYRSLPKKAELSSGGTVNFDYNSVNTTTVPESKTLNQVFYRTLGMTGKTLQWTCK